ncbi:hypothetical protein OE88DRAFT_1736478 [Heliocybe sulcata]|uniref:C2H2-type domain-containing protein n=1 Tax=Heliocybe sulcata TaxID=5364 RepID=A0A5C3MZD0_9AGAM|nr:hypothetical protein OE88DRAFT_1736478 [Heliocybe sulcata]
MPKAATVPRSLLPQLRSEATSSALHGSAHATYPRESSRYTRDSQTVEQNPSLCDMSPRKTSTAVSVAPRPPVPPYAPATFSREDWDAAMAIITLIPDFAIAAGLRPRGPEDRPQPGSKKGGTRPEDLTCRVGGCPKNNFLSRRICNYHRETHFPTKRWACPGCAKRFKNDQMLRNHLRVEDGCLQASGGTRAWAPNMENFCVEKVAPWEGHLLPLDQCQ